MAFDEKLAERIRDILDEVGGVSERKMFGGLCFTINGNMLCGVLQDRLMARVGPGACDTALKRKHVHEMDFTGRPSRAMVYVEAAGIKTRKQLASWIETCLVFATSLPPK